MENRESGAGKRASLGIGASEVSSTCRLPTLLVYLAKHQLGRAYSGECVAPKRSPFPLHFRGNQYQARLFLRSEIPYTRLMDIVKVEELFEDGQVRAASWTKESRAIHDCVGPFR